MGVRVTPPFGIVLAAFLLLVAVLMIAIAPWDAWLRPGPTLSPAPSPYSAALNSFFAEPRNDHQFLGLDSPPHLIVLADSTYPLSYVAELRATFPELDSSTLQRFVADNQVAVAVRDTIRLRRPVQILSTHLRRAIRAQGEFWAAFYRRFPGAQGIGYVSRLTMSTDSTLAIVSVGNQRGPLDGAGFFLLLKRVAAGWVVVRWRLAWES